MRPSPCSTSRTRERLAWASALLLVGLTAAAMVAWATRSVSIPPETTRTLLSVAPTDQSSGANPLEQRVGGARPTRTAVALSPDGKTLVFGAIWGGGQQLYARAMDQLSATPMSGTSGGEQSLFLARRSMGRLCGRGANSGRFLSVADRRSRCARRRRSSGRAGAATGPLCLRPPGTGACGVCRPREALPRRSRPFSQASTVTGCPTCCPAATP